ncbi:Phospholipase A [Forsythia ovata]|uniref:Phospholipase A n=1 Tax=Forsythia ovata TaxID=205694 RepID=A0ABD1SL14_9LAMI
MVTNAIEIDHLTSCLTNIKCHEKFKRCIKKVQKSMKVGFSKNCPYDTAVPIMVQGKLKPWSLYCETKGLRRVHVGGSSLEIIARHARDQGGNPPWFVRKTRGIFFLGFVTNRGEFSIPELLQASAARV